jgi:hypothetical protein
MSIIKGIETLQSSYNGNRNGCGEVWATEMVARFLIELAEEAGYNEIGDICTIQGNLKKDLEEVSSDNNLGPFGNVNLGDVMSISRHLLRLAEVVGYPHIRELHEVQVELRATRRFDFNASASSLRSIIRHSLELWKIIRVN